VIQGEVSSEEGKERKGIQDNSFAFMEVCEHGNDIYLDVVIYHQFINAGKWRLIH